MQSRRCCFLFSCVGEEGGTHTHLRMMRLMEGMRLHNMKALRRTLRSSSSVMICFIKPLGGSFNSGVSQSRMLGGERPDSRWDANTGDFLV